MCAYLKYYIYDRLLSKNLKSLSSSSNNVPKYHFITFVCVCAGCVLAHTGGGQRLMWGTSSVASHLVFWDSFSLNLALRLDWLATELQGAPDFFSLCDKVPGTWLWLIGLFYVGSMDLNSGKMLEHQVFCWLSYCLTPFSLLPHLANLRNLSQLNRQKIRTYCLGW